MLDISSSSLTEPLLSDGSQKRNRCHKLLIVLTVIIVITALIAAASALLRGTQLQQFADQLFLAFLPFSVELHAQDLASLEIKDGSPCCSHSPNFSIL